jgi:DinB superfamily
MITTISTTQFTFELLSLLTETFESVQGIYLDRGTSLTETLAGITAQEASIPVGNKCATIAAQVTHVCFYLDVLYRYIKTGQNEQVDWGEIWRTVREVTPEEWSALQERLRKTYERTKEMVQSYDRWDTENSLGGAMAIVAHTAYHLGEIRQATCTLKK